MTVELKGLSEELQQEIRSYNTGLEPLSPEEGVEKYIEWKEGEIRPQTIDEYETKLGHFLDYCDSNDIDNLNNLSGRDIKEYSRYRRDETKPNGGELSSNTLKDDMYILQEMCRFLAEIEAVYEDLFKKVDIPSLEAGEGVRNIRIDSDHLNQIIEHLETYEYATREHIIWCLFTETGRRPSDIYALDIEDHYSKDDKPYIKICHREETQLKNGKKGETKIAISDYTSKAIEDYIAKNRIDVETENGREPLLTSHQGRLSKQSIRKEVYRYSCPCVVTDECPHGRDISQCDAAQKLNHAYECPSSKPPYALRHTYITERRNQGVPVDVLTERCDVSEPVLDKHYDERNEDEKRELRREILEKVRSERNNGGRYL